MKDGQCLRCGRGNCKVRYCPLSAAIPPAAAGNTRPKNKTVSTSLQVKEV